MVQTSDKIESTKVWNTKIGFNAMKELFVICFPGSNSTNYQMNYKKY